MYKLKRSQFIFTAKQEGNECSIARLFMDSFFMWKAPTRQRENANLNSKVSKSLAIATISHTFHCWHKLGKWWEKDLSTSDLNADLKLKVIVNAVTQFALWICIVLSTGNSNESPGLLEATGFSIIHVINIFLLLGKGKNYTLFKKKAGIYKRDMVVFRKEWWEIKQNCNQVLILLFEIYAVVKITFWNIKSKHS